ncbi:Glycoprotein-N-acetylgalactosamine 3-beta-galactosyltransferase 1-B [Bulinus truncatus]|nr:Glycoprotein-N-acetylgalactosamine 3-beta-galactosyltransferase 1-B [Bulinus truncatus]
MLHTVVCKSRVYVDTCYTWLFGNHESRKYFTVSVDNSTALLRRVHTSTDAVISVDLLYKSNVIKIGDLDTTNGTEYVGVTGKRTDKVRVLVWVMTSPDSHATKAKAVKETWGKRCHILLFFSSKDDPLLPVIGLNVSEGRDHLSAKTLKAFQYVYKLYFDEADWFMKVDDDTFVIPDNLKYFLSDKNPNEPKYYGHHFKAYIENGYNSGGAGYVLSKEALRRFMENSTLFNGLFEERSAEDLEIGKCMEKLGVEVSDSTDSLGRSRFHCFNPFYHLQGYFPDWYLKMDSHGAQKV